MQKAPIHYLEPPQSVSVVPEDDSDAHKPGGILGRELTPPPVAVPAESSNSASSAVDEFNLFTPDHTIKQRIEHDHVPDNADLQRRQEGTTIDGQLDEDYMTMAAYDKRAFNPHATFSYKMSLALVTLGFLFSGLGAFTNHWRKDGCLLYKLTVLEGTTYECCSPKFRLDEVVAFVDAEREAALSTPAPTEAGVEVAYCTNLANWRDLDAKTAHVIALCLVLMGLTARMGAVYSFTDEGYRKYYPALIVTCSVLGFCAVLAYVLSWNKDGLTPGPGMACVGLQSLLDLMSYFSTVNGRRKDTNGNKRPKITELFESFTDTPLLARIVMGVYMGFWGPMIVALTMPWKEINECDQFLVTPEAVNTPEEYVKPLLFAGETAAPTCIDTCPVRYGVLLSQSDCDGANFIFGSRSERVGMMAVSCLFVLVSLFFLLIATYFVWNAPLRFPKFAVFSLVSMLLAVVVFALMSTEVLSNTTLYNLPPLFFQFGTYKKAYVAVSLYTTFTLILVIIMFCRYKNQLWSRNFHKRRANPSAQQTDQAKAAHVKRPIVTTREAVPSRVQFLGGHFRRTELAGLQGDASATELEFLERQRRRARLGRAAQAAQEKVDREIYLRAEAEAQAHAHAQQSAAVVEPASHVPAQQAQQHPISSPVTHRRSAKGGVGVVGVASPQHDPAAGRHVIEIEWEQNPLDTMFAKSAPRER